MPINPFVPLMMFAILFGLSMDYEVFLLSRIREEYVATGDNHKSVVDGLSSTARVITSAALIMISVFGAFVLGDDPDRQAVRCRPRRRRVPRRHARAHGARAGDDEPPRAGQLVAARHGSTGSFRTSTSKRHRSRPKSSSSTTRTTIASSSRPDPMVRRGGCVVTTQPPRPCALRETASDAAE